MLNVGVGRTDHNAKKSFLRATIEGVRFIREPRLPIFRLGKIIPSLGAVSDLTLIFGWWIGKVSKKFERTFETGKSGICSEPQLNVQLGHRF